MRAIAGSIALATLSCALSANASILIYDGTYANGWAKGQWDMTTNDEMYYGDTGPSLSTMPLSGTGSTTVGFVNSGGMSVGQNYILSFYINTVDDNPSGTILVRILWQGATDNLNFDGRNIPAVYVVDGVPTDYGFTTDSDSSTWQHVTIDLTQTRYPGWPYVPTTWDPATQPLTHITINPGSNNVIVDNVSLIAVPEPGTLAAASILSGAALLRRRRR